jgi:hypothetical protein
MRTRCAITSALDEAIGASIISAMLWPPRPPDRRVCDFYLQGKPKENSTATQLALLKASLRAVGDDLEHFLQLLVSSLFI